MYYRVPKTKIYRKATKGEDKQMRVFLVALSLLYLSYGKAHPVSRCVKSFSGPRDAARQATHSSAREQNEQIPSAKTRTPLSLEKNSYVDPDGKVFLQAWNAEKFETDQQYISLRYKKGRSINLLAKVITAKKDYIVLEFIVGLGETQQYRFFREEFYQHFKDIKISFTAQSAFHRLKNPKKTLKAVNPPKVNEERALQNMDLREIFVIGVNAMNYLKYIGHKLMENNINPYTTHIENFANNINAHIRFIREGILLQNKEVKQRLDILLSLEKEALKRMKEKKVTYEWWLFWNYRLSIVATPTRHREHHSLRKIESWTTNLTFQTVNSLSDNLFTTTNNLPAFNIGNSRAPTQKPGSEINEYPIISAPLANSIRNFPQIIFLPTTKKMGVIALNRAVVYRLFPLGLIRREEIADGEPVSPDEYYTHDISHSIDGFIAERRGPYTARESAGRLYYHYDQKSMGYRLNSREREMIEMIFYLLLHEDLPSNIDPLKKPDNKNAFFTKDIMEQVILHNKSRLYSKQDLGAILPPEVISDSHLINKYLEQAVNTFIHTISQMETSPASKP